MITTSDKLKIAAEIHTKATENCISVIIFETQEDMKMCLEDMRLGAAVRAGLKNLNIPMVKEWIH